MRNLLQHSEFYSTLPNFLPLKEEENNAGQNLELILMRWNLTYPKLVSLINVDSINNESIGNVKLKKTKPSAVLLKRLQELTGISMYELYVNEITEKQIPKRPIKKEQEDEIIPEGATHLSADFGAKLVAPIHSNWKSMKMEDYFAQMEELRNELKQVKNKVAALEQGE